MMRNNLIRYPDSPTGKAYIGIAKEPLMPNKNGIGFKGVLLQDEKRTRVQCTHNRGSALYKALMRRFGSASKGFQYYGRPYRTRRGTNMFFEFPDKTIYRYNINRVHDREALFRMMIEKCTLFNSHKP